MAYQDRLRDHIGPCSGTDGMGYRAVHLSRYMERLGVQLKNWTSERRETFCQEISAEYSPATKQSHHRGQAGSSAHIQKCHSFLGFL